MRTKKNVDKVEENVKELSEYFGLSVAEMRKFMLAVMAKQLMERYLYEDDYGE